MNRRRFLKRTLLGLLLLQIGYVLVRLLKHEPKTAHTEMWYDAGALSTFEKGKVYLFSSRGFYLFRTNEGGLLALSLQCTHLGCKINYNKRNHQLECPCHASAFNQKGEVLSPPATRALDYFPVKVDGQKVMVDLAQPLRRKRFEQEQVTTVDYEA
jgi:Rieske Fe-S protein